MKNIKIIGASFILASAIAFVSASAMAKTKGHNFNVNIAQNKASHEYYVSGRKVTNYPEFSNSKTGFGIAYKYAFNHNNLFIAPGIFYDKIGTKAQDQDTDTISINNRYGARLDFGYDITEKLALYGFGGISGVDYKVNWKSVNLKTSGREFSPIVGLGAIFYPTQNIAINLEYGFQTIKTATPDLAGYPINEVRSDINTVKIGFGYQF